MCSPFPKSIRRESGSSCLLMVHSARSLLAENLHGVASASCLDREGRTLCPVLPFCEAKITLVRWLGLYFIESCQFPVLYPHPYHSL